MHEVPAIDPLVWMSTMAPLPMVTVVLWYSINISVYASILFMTLNIIDRSSSCRALIKIHTYLCSLVSVQDIDLDCPGVTASKRACGKSKLSVTNSMSERRGVVLSCRPENTAWMSTCYLWLLQLCSTSRNHISGSKRSRSKGHVRIYSGRSANPWGVSSKPRLR